MNCRMPGDALMQLVASALSMKRHEIFVVAEQILNKTRETSCPLDPEHNAHISFEVAAVFNLQIFCCNARLYTD